MRLHGSSPALAATCTESLILSFMALITTLYSLERAPLLGIVLSSNGESVLSLKFITKKSVHGNVLQHLDTEHAENQLHQRAHAQLDEYFAGNLRSFDLPLQPEGTEFQLRVWQAIAAIPFGQVLTYGQIASQLGDSGLARAVGQAANKNPIPLIVPCHRVVGAGGKLTGFASGVELKSYLLSHERRDRLW